MNGQHAVVFGAGKLACGLLGQLLTESGYTTTFVARRPEVVDALNRQQGYLLQVAETRVRRQRIRHCAALSIQRQPDVVDAVARADVVFTAVGIDNLGAIAPVIAASLWQRARQRAPAPLNVIACENLPGAGAYLQQQVVTAAPLERALAVEAIGGFSAALTRRIMTGGGIERGQLVFAADAKADLVIDTAGLKGPPPRLRGATYTAEFRAMVMRKLFTLNCVHAVAAYFGYQEGCRYVHEAAVHPRVAPVIQGALDEARAALVAEFPAQAVAIDQDATEALARIANPQLADPIARVARDPRRKLSPRERLVGPARLAHQHRLPYDYLSLGIAGALAYDNPDDAQAVAMRQAIVAEGVDKILTEDCGLLPHEALARAVKRQWPAVLARAMHGQASVTPATQPHDSLMQALATQLSQHYDSTLVRAVLAQVAEAFREAPARTLMPALLKTVATEPALEVAR